jgi:hypothetical protein
VVCGEGIASKLTFFLPNNIPHFVRLFNNRAEQGKPQTRSSPATRACSFCFITV